jgi:hypothetical protein
VFTAGIVVTVMLATLLGYTAARKLGHRPSVVQAYERVGVPEDWLNWLALILMAGVAGIVLGWFWAPIGIAAGIGLVIYFLLALGAHVLARDQRNLPTPVVMLLLSLAVLALRLVTS